jgi:hypothetical protein
MRLKLNKSDLLYKDVEDFFLEQNCIRIHINQSIKVAVKCKIYIKISGCVPAHIYELQGAIASNVAVTQHWLPSYIRSPESYYSALNSLLCL